MKSPTTIIFEQPVLNGIDGNFHVPPAEHRYPTAQPFNLVLWQPNPNRPDGELVPTGWSAGDMTGFHPRAPLTAHQAAFRDASGASTVQIAGDTVGVYLNSADLSVGAKSGNKMMITPAYKLSADRLVRPFAEAGMALENSLQLQIPTARDLNIRHGSMTYVVINYVFRDRTTSTLISYGVGLFHHLAASPLTPAWLQKTEVGGFDGPSHSYQVGNNLAPGSRVVTMLPGSTLYQSQPWRGWRDFRCAITAANFQSGLDALKAKGNGFAGSDNPADYVLTEWHLNAELQFGQAPTELGWSMRHARLALVPEAQLGAAP